MTGNLILNADPTTNLAAATKQYVDKGIAEQYEKLLIDDYTHTSARAQHSFEINDISQIGFIPRGICLEARLSVSSGQFISGFLSSEEWPSVQTNNFYLNFNNPGPLASTKTIYFVKYIDTVRINEQVIELGFLEASNCDILIPVVSGQKRICYLCQPGTNSFVGSIRFLTYFF